MGSASETGIVICVMIVAGADEELQPIRERNRIDDDGAIVCRRAIEYERYRALVLEVVADLGDAQRLGFALQRA